MNGFSFSSVVNWGFKDTTVYSLKSRCILPALYGYAALPICFSAMARSKTNLIFLTGMFEDNEHPISILIIKPNSSISSFQDFEGKRIGILPTRAYEVWLQQILLRNSINPTDVIVQQVAPNLQSDALNSGAVDILFTNDPAAAIAIQKGYGVSFSPDTAVVPKFTDMSPFYFGSFCISEKFSKENPETVIGIAKALDEAIDLIMTNPDEALKSFTKEYLPEQQLQFVSGFTKSLYKKTNDVKQFDLESIKNYYFKSNVLPCDIDVEKLQFKY